MVLILQLRGVSLLSSGGRTDGRVQISILRQLCRKLGPQEGIMMGEIFYTLRVYIVFLSQTVV